MSKSKRVLILDREDIQKKTTRIAYQILEDNFDEQELVLAGIADRGYIFAQRLKTILEEISSFRVILIKIMLDKEGPSLDASTDIPAAEATDKVVILVDDVLNSGRALSYGLGVFLNVPLKKIRTAVLIDRSHHKFPVFSDFSGLRLSTILKEHVTISLSEFDGGSDSAWLS